MIDIKWLGRGGQGAFTSARLLGQSASIHGNKFSLVFPAFGPERRGAPVNAFTKISDKKIIDRSQSAKCDYLVVLDETLFSTKSLQELKIGGRAIINSSSPENYKEYKDSIVTIDATTIALDVLKKPITNTALLGALIAISGIISIDAVISGIDDLMPKSISSKNKEIVKRAYISLKEGI